MKLPLPGKYVLIHLTKDNWHDSEDPEGVYWDVAKLVQGISKEERAALEDSDNRKHTYCFGDEEGNNLVPYSWETFGPSQYFGQEVDQWEYLPERKQK